MRRIIRYLPLFLIFLGVPLAAHAQANSFDIAIGFGTNFDKTNGAGIDTANTIDGGTSSNAGGACTYPNSSDPFCDETPGLGGFFLGGSGDYMFRQHFGLGFEGVFQPVQESYTPGTYTYRQTFYDFNAIYAPINEKRVSVKIQGGIGGARTGIYVTGQECSFCGHVTELIDDANHFAIHASAGVQIYVTEHIFIRPQFDYRYVPGFTDQFGSNGVPGGSVWLGYSFGDR